VNVQPEDLPGGQQKLPKGFNSPKVGETIISHTCCTGLNICGHIFINWNRNVVVDVAWLFSCLLQNNSEIFEFQR